MSVAEPAGNGTIEPDRPVRIACIGLRERGRGRATSASSASAKSCHGASSRARPVMSSSKSLRPLKRGEPAMRGVRMTLSNDSSSSSSGDRLLIVHVERHAAEPAGAQGLDQRVAVDDRGVGDVDDAGAGLDLRELGAADEVARRRQRRQLRHDPVAFGEQRRQRHVTRAFSSRSSASGSARALVVEHVHVEGPGADRNLAPDLAQANDADGRTVERAGAADAGVVAAGRVPAVERPVGALGGLDAFDGDEAVELVELARQHQHQAEGMLGAGDVGAAAQREQLDALRRRRRRCRCCEARCRISARP